MTMPSFHKEKEPPKGLRESRSLEHAHAELAKRYLALKAEFTSTTGRELFETSVWRSAEKQKELWKQGREAPGAIVTNADGVKIKSRHQGYPSRALDVCVDLDPGPGKKAGWANELYAPLGPLAVKHGLVWGGAWTKFKDLPHLELPPEVA